MIHIEGLHKKFGKNPVLSGLDLTINKEGVFAVLGPNGSGKTTLIKSILGMVVPDKGTISVQGEPIKKNWKYRKEIDYLPQIANFPGNLKVRELIRMIKDLRQSPSDEDRLIALFKLEPFLDKKLSTLSGGTKQKVNIVLAFMFNSPLLILDEPTTGLDPASLIHLKELIREQREMKKTILITSHIMQFVAEVSDVIVYLLEGNIYFKGSIEELKTKTGQTDLEHAIAAIATAPSHA
ncbi:ABC transporter ATP-binding protein [Zobellia galactanivorans]|uniref:Copper ABC transporter, ATPase component n=1 Tax=Zobellia galactanivorans (strain DSM 12802 / CCUG 47099 / CIP 106680 / NCIMB 13871 / Dsij) TaxID=63186 RepID=G0LBR8_ZOBGA|nr:MULTISPECIES: ABC transporter ATP-binding protein [Zobellia]MBU3026181.1 ABC transporter ATP-binding protein [Zobellia galactanivorans]MDO6807342.1 ABC transporter ATP-binding protein [Zobellia galactanivorans]OWW27259.1 copper ABC transporter ATP-binding protein [Zobellia sp. OII3]CAZ96397.1 Copper ABC transporter, ATPase component [Zobellia galactanivorans]